MWRNGIKYKYMFYVPSEKFSTERVTLSKPKQNLQVGQVQLIWSIVGESKTQEEN